MKCPMLKLQYEETRPCPDYPDHSIEVIVEVFQDCIGKECAWWKHCSLEQAPVRIEKLPYILNVEPSSIESHFSEV